MVALSACAVTYMVIHVCLLVVNLLYQLPLRLAPGWCSISLLVILGPLPHILICGILLFTILCHKNSNDDGSHSQNEYYHHSNHSTNNPRHTPWLTSRAWKVTRIKLSHTLIASGCTVSHWVPLISKESISQMALNHRRILAEFACIFALLLMLSIYMQAKFSKKQI